MAPDGARRAFGPGGAPAPHARTVPAVLQFRDWQVAADALKGGDVAFAESYIDGRWDTPDLTQLLTVLAANQPALERAFRGHWWTRSLLRLKHYLNSNTRAAGTPQHRRALRPRQRLLPAVARPDR